MKFLFREENPLCLVKEDGEQHRMIPDDVEEGSQVFSGQLMAHLSYVLSIYRSSFLISLLSGTLLKSK